MFIRKKRTIKKQGLFVRSKSHKYVISMRYKHKQCKVDKGIETEGKTRGKKVDEVKENCKIKLLYTQTTITL